MLGMQPKKGFSSSNSKQVLDFSNELNIFSNRFNDQDFGKELSVFTKADCESSTVHFDRDRVLKLFRGLRWGKVLALIASEVVSLKIVQKNWQIFSALSLSNLLSSIRSLVFGKALLLYLCQRLTLLNHPMTIDLWQ